MALDTALAIPPYEAPVKDLYEVGEMPPLGHVPAKMYAWAIRRERRRSGSGAMKLPMAPSRSSPVCRRNN